MSDTILTTRIRKTENDYREITEALRYRYLQQRAEKNGLLDIFLGSTDVNPGEIDSQRAETEASVFDSTYCEIATWISECAKGWRPSTLRLRRAALTFAFKEELASVDDNAPDRKRIEVDCNEAIEILQAAKTPRAKDVAPVKSAKKQKSVKESDMKKLGDFVRSTNTIWRTRAFRFLIANIVTGLRPIEWRNVVIGGDPDKGILTLEVTNAKATNGRGNGATRTLTISDNHERNAVLVHLYELESFRAKEPEQPYEGYKKRCSDALYSTCKILWPKRKTTISLYTGRHQFAANKKASGLSKAELANLMGHESIETAGSHYGKKRSGWASSPQKKHSVTYSSAKSLKQSPAP